MQIFNINQKYIEDALQETYNYKEVKSINQDDIGNNLFPLKCIYSFYETMILM